MFTVYYDTPLQLHGVKGMIWGVRRYRNRDGTLTPAGKKRARDGRRTIAAAKTKNDVDSIIATMSSKDKERLAVQDGYLAYEQGQYVAKRIIKKIGDTPVAFFDILQDGDDQYNVALGTHADYRGRGYGAEVARKGMDWYERNKERLGITKVTWGVMSDNEGSIAIAKKNGFEFEEGSRRDGWETYVR